jgi:putative SOS response-associated peptidase YedK
MCGRFQISKTEDQIQIRFHVDVEKEWLKQIFNAGPMMQLPVITNEEPEHLNFFRWGLVPYWAKDAAIGVKMINAKSETLAEKPAFKSALQKRRCLIPANGFYEWEKAGKSKIPHRFFLESEELFAFAGLWESWKDPSGIILRTFTIITTTPNELVSPIHDRMPVILDPDFEKHWLDAQVPVEDLLEMLRPYPAQKMKQYRVSEKVNNVRNNTPDLPLEYVENTLF